MHDQQHHGEQDDERDDDARSGERGGWRAVAAARPVWTFTYEFAPGLTANCVAVQFAPRRWAVLSPGSNMSEESLSAIARAGEVVALVAPNKNHHVGLKSWRARFPDARVYAPAAALKALRGRYPDCSLDAIAALREQLPAEVVLRCSPHSKAGCTTLLVRRATGWLWHTDDLVLNMDEYEGPLPVRWLMGLMRMVGGVRVNRMNRIFFVTDRAALKRELLADLETYPITALIPAHGVVGEDPELAARLRRSIEEVL